jgi:hypothetical protein
MEKMGTSMKNPHFEALDPVGQEDGDIDNDGDKDKSDKYLLNRRKKIGRAIAANEGVEITEEMVASNAAHYFYEEGINEKGVEIFIEELGLEEFVSFVEDLSADLLIEERAARRARKGAKSYAQVKAEIDAKEAAKKKASPAKVQSATVTAKSQQPKKRGALDSIARTVLKGMDRHKAAMARAKSDIQTTKKIASKVSKGAREFGKGFASGVKTAGKTAKLAKKAMEEYSDWRSDLQEQGLIEVIDDAEQNKPIKEKKVNNKVKINPKLGEAIEKMGGTLIEEIEVDEMDYVVESVYDELIEEGFSEDDVEEAIEYALTEAKVTYGHDTETPRQKMMKQAKGRLRFLGRKAGEKVQQAKQQVGKSTNKLRGKVAGAAVAATMAGGIAKDQARRTGRAVKQAVTSAPGKAKKSIKDRIKQGALAVAKRMSEENIEELYKGKHGQSEKEYADSRSQGGKMVSGNSKMSGAEYTHGRRVKAANPGMQPDVGGKTKPKSQGKMDKGTRADLEYRKAKMKETGVTEQNELDEAKKKLPYGKMFRKAGNLGRDGSPEAMKRSKKITGVMNKNAERVAAHRERDDAAKNAKDARRAAEKARQAKAKMKEELSIADQMRISRDAAKDRKPFDPEARQKQRAAQIKDIVKHSKTNKTDAERMADAYASPRKGPGGATRAD